MMRTSEVFPKGLLRRGGILGLPPLGAGGAARPVAPIV